MSKEKKWWKRRDAIYNIIQNQIDDLMPAREVFDCEIVTELVRLQTQMGGAFYQVRLCSVFDKDEEE